MNEAKPKFPPDIFYIRRNEMLKKRFLNKEEFENLLEEVDEKNKFNYSVFKLDKPLPPVSTYSEKFGEVKKYVRPVVTKHELLR